MTTPIHCLVAFAGGMGYDAGYIFWAHYAERSRVWKVTLIVTMIATFEVTGLLQAISGVGPAVSLVAGCATGAALATILKKRFCGS
jgi:hypothetical protein